MNRARWTVWVLGAGHVGAAVANALVLLRVCDRVVLYERDPAVAEGEAWDIADAVPLVSEVDVAAAAGYADLAGCDVVVITAGVTLGPGQTRLDLLAANADTIAGIVGELDRVCPAAVVILVTNPVDVLTRIAIEASARPAHLVLGCGTVLDGARRKGYTSYGAAAAVARIVRAITRDEKRILMVSALAAREYQIGPVVLGLPCVIGAAGIDRQLLLPMSAQERQLLRRSAAVLDQAYRSLAAGRAATAPE